MTGGPVVVLGGSGWAATAFTRALSRRQIAFVCWSRKVERYDQFGELTRLLRQTQPRFLINAAGFTGKPNVDACEDARGETLRGNVLLPVTIAHACETAGVTWGHVSSGSIYSGAKLAGSHGLDVHKDLTSQEARQELDAGASIVGFDETDPPNFSFDDPPCSFYSGSKALAESALADSPSLYIWRMRLPFDEHAGPRNLLSKLLTYPRLYQNINSVSHLGHCVEACLDLWLGDAPFGTYNLTNPGFVTTRDIVRLLQTHLVPDRQFEFWENDVAFYTHAARALRSNCILDSSKALAAGAKLPPVEEALVEALRKWDGPR